MAEAAPPQHRAAANQNTAVDLTGPRLFYKVLLAGLGITFLFQVIGLVTPGWLVLDLNVQSIDLKVSMGLWYVNYCLEEACDTTDLDTFWDKHYAGPKDTVSHEMTQYQVETVIAVLATVVGIVCFIKLLWCSQSGIYSNGKIIWQILMATTALSALLDLVASVLYGKDIQEAHESFDGSNPSPYSEPWSLIITGVGGLMSAVIWVIIVLETCRASTTIDRAHGFDSFDAVNRRLDAELDHLRHPPPYRPTLRDEFNIQTRRWEQKYR